MGQTSESSESTAAATGLVFETAMRIVIFEAVSSKRVVFKWLMRASTRWQDNFAKESRNAAGLTAALHVVQTKGWWRHMIEDFISIDF